MSTDQWQQVKELFAAVVEQEPRRQSAFLEEAGAGDAVRREVERLLAAHERTGDFLAQPVFESTLPTDANEASPAELTGRVLSHYKIIEKVGEGGMAVVYRARDLQLDRNVALKLLSGETAVDSERRQKLGKEAKAASALDHPNIVTIYETGSAGDLSFIAMELVEGETLDRILGRGPLPLTEAMRYGFQVADALSAAHAAGIVHLDLKPSNIMVRPDGWVKVLDFGLARRRPPIGSGPPESLGSQSSSTEEGAFGTPVYMSPEQAEGKDLDARSDIFSFAAVLYEMIAGARPFLGDTPLATLAAILHQEPKPLGRIVDPTAHPEILQIERVVKRGLRKDRQSRWQSIADMKLALQDALEEREQPHSSGVARLHYAWLWPGLIGLGLLVSGVAFWKSDLGERAPPSFQRLTFRRGSIESARFAPDGQTILYSAAWEGNPLEIFAARLGNRESRSLGLPAGKLLSVNPSGELAILLSPGWRDRTGTLARAPLAGGAPREILENVSGGDWGPHGALVMARSVGGRNRLEFPMGTVLYESQGLPPVSPVMSPSGEWIAFFDHDEIGNFSVVVAGVHGERRVLSKGWRAIAGLGWSPKGDEVWFSAVRSGEQLQAVRGVTLSGTQRIVSPTLGLVTIHDIARDGRVLAASSNTRISMHFLRAGSGERDLSWFDTSLLYGLSEDGRMLLFAELAYGDDQNPAVYLRPTDGTAAVRLGEGNMPSLSPDGKWVVCVRSERERSQIILLPTGPGETRVLPAGDLFYHSAELSPDGRRLLVQAEQKNRPVRTYLQDLAGGNPRAVTPEGTRATRFSPDGRLALVASGGHLSTLALDSKEQKPIATLNSGESVLRWSRDGRSLFLRHTDSPLSVTVYRLDVFTGRRERIREINSPDSIARIGNVAITLDGKSLAYSFQSDLEDLYLVKGWR